MDVYYNAQMPSRMVYEVCKLTPAGLALLKTAMERLQLSARAFALGGRGEWGLQKIL